MSKANDTIREAVKETLGVLTEHIQLGERDCEGTVHKVAVILDSPIVEKALEESDASGHGARHAAISQRERPKDYPPQIARVPTKHGDLVREKRRKWVP